MKNLEEHMPLLSRSLSHPRRSPKPKLQPRAKARRKKAPHTKRSHVCLKWVSIMGRVPQSPLLASLPTAFCLQTFTSCLLAQNTNKSHGGHFIVAMETVIIISNILNASVFPLQYLATAWCLMGRLHCERRKRAGKRALTASHPALKTQHLCSCP